MEDKLNIEEIFNYKKEFKGLTENEETWVNYKVKRLKFLSPILSNYEENNWIHGGVFYPSSNFNGKVILAIHQYHEAIPIFEEAVAHYFLRYGYKVAYISLPFHKERAPKGTKSGELFFSFEEDHTFFSMRQSIVDLKIFMDYLLEKEGDKIFAIGLSLGAILLNLLMGVDKRVSKGVSIMGGGNMMRITIEGIYGLSARVHYKKQGLTWETYEEETRKFLNYVDEVCKRKKLLPPPHKWYLVDPLTYACFNRPRKVLFINGIFDKIIPKKAVIELWKKLGKPKIVWIPSTHYTIPIFFPYAMKLSVDFFKNS